MNKADLKDLALSILIALGINLLFVALAALIYGLLGLPHLIGPLCASFAGLWVALLVITLLLIPVERLFRLNIYDRANAYLALNVAAGGLLMLAFAAVMALRAHQVVNGFVNDSLGITIAVYVIGFLACYVAHAVVTPVFRGQLYTLTNFVFALGGYVLFALWPAAARALFGWLIA